MTKEEQLKSIFADDPFGLLEIKPKNNHRNAEERLVANFQEIVDFYEANSKEPYFSKIDIHESNLYYALKALRESNEKRLALKDYDVYDLLNVHYKDEVEISTVEEPPTVINSIDDIFKNDPFGLLSNEDSIFDIKHVTPVKARRKPIQDFDKYEPFFKQCHLDIKSGERKLVKFNEAAIKKGSFFVVDGILAYVADTYKLKVDKHSKLDGRIKCVFENGTASNLLFRSLGKALYKNGQTVTEILSNTDLIIQAITPDDIEAGFIYVLKSKSSNPSVKSVPNLYKIGYSITTVEERVKNASKEPTYLMAPVQIISTYKCFNINPQKFENFIHNFFAKVCLNIDIYDNNGNRHVPREWFSVPLNVIDETISLIISDEIKEYKYDDENEKLLKL
jgi:hypothetical protein